MDERMAAQAVSIAQDAICMRHPHLAGSVHRMKIEIAPNAEPPAFDGETIHIGDAWVYGALHESDGRIADALMHILAHALLGHVWKYASEPWRDAACDLLAAFFLSDIAPERCAMHGDARFDELRRRFAGAADADALAEKLRADAYFAQNENALRDLLALDSHALWKRARAADHARGCGGSASAYFQKQSALLLHRRREEAGTNDAFSVWRARLKNADASDFVSYLNRYACVRENPRSDPDAFQYSWYVYGLSHYGNVPLIEPMEYREEKKLDSLVIAIDTSGSCVRGLTQHFLSLTRDIIAGHDLFFRRFNLRILQCDVRIRRDDLITNMDQFDQYIRDLTIVGGGGTDFRPVFDRVTELRKTDVHRRLRGVLFFSDGRGIFPSVPPDFEITFVFLKHRFDAIDVPAWVRRLVIDAPVPRGDEYMEY